MVDANKLKTGALILGALLLLFIAFFASMMVGGLVVGSITNTGTSGDVNISAAMTQHLIDNEVTYTSQMETLDNNVLTIIGLVAIVVIVTVFGFRFNFGGGSGGRGGFQ